HPLDMERCMFRNRQDEARAGSHSCRGAGFRDIEIKLLVPRIECALFDAIGENVVSLFIFAVERDGPKDFVGLCRDEGNEVVYRLIVRDQDRVGEWIIAELVGSRLPPQITLTSEDGWRNEVTAEVQHLNGTVRRNGAGTTRGVDRSIADPYLIPDDHQ